MSLFNKLREPIFLKEAGSAEKRLEQLQSIDRARLPADMQSRLDQEIKLVSLGIKGEKSIEFELRNSHLPMYILHDVRLEKGDLSAQIDYLVVSRRHVFVIECKNLYGNIEINEKGDFIRTVNFGARYQKEGIYSPVTQNQRHLDIIRLIRREERSNFLSRTLFERNFSNAYRSIIVLANSKTVLKDKSADEAIKAQVIRADALISHIKRINASEDSADWTDEHMEALARFFLDAHIERDIDYAAKYRDDIRDDIADTPPQAQEEAACRQEAPASEPDVMCPRCGAAMVLRTAKKGKSVGKQFLGCSAFPKCRKVIELD